MVLEHTTLGEIGRNTNKVTILDIEGIITAHCLPSQFITFTTSSATTFVLPNATIDIIEDDPAGMICVVMRVVPETAILDKDVVVTLSSMDETGRYRVDS